MKFSFTAVLILVFFSSTGYGNEVLGTSIQNARNIIKKEISWNDYTKYSLPSSFLYNAGFQQKSNCAIALMKTIPDKVNFNDLMKMDNVFKERDKIFRGVILDGVEILKGSKLFPKASSQNLVKYVYQNLMQSERMLNTAMIFLKDSSEKSNEKYEFALTNLSYFKRIYATNNCFIALKYKALNN